MPVDLAASPQSPHAQRIRAVVWIVLGSALFTLVYVMPRTADVAPAVAWIVFLRYAGGFLTVLPVAVTRLRRHGRLRRAGLGGHLFRVGASLGSSAFFYFALLTIPVADAVAISMTEAAFCLVFAGMILGERVGFRRWIAVLLAVTGAIVVANPSGGAFSASLISIGALAALAGAVFMGLESIAYRLLAPKEDAVTIVIYLNALCALAVLPLALAMGMPGPVDEYWPVFLMGPVAALAQVCNVKAFALAEASFLAPLPYIGLPIAAILGYLLFSEVPGLTTWIGSAIILVAAWIALRRKG